MHWLLLLPENAKGLLHFIKVICIPMSLTVVHVSVLNFQEVDIKAVGNPLCTV